MDRKLELLNKYDPEWMFKIAGDSIIALLFFSQAMIRLSTENYIILCEKLINVKNLNGDKLGYFYKELCDLNISMCFSVLYAIPPDDITKAINLTKEEAWDIFRNRALYNVKTALVNGVLSSINKN